MVNAKILRRLGALLLVATAAAAQQQAAPTVPQPKIYALFPSGGKAGTVVDVRISSGTDLDGVQKLLFSHPGITAKPLMEEPSRIYPQGRAIDGKFKVSVAADVPPGIYEVRAAGYFGVTNARRFTVGSRDEVAEKEPNNDAATAQEPPLGSVVTGTCDAQNYDFYKIAAKKGQRYLAEIQALRIDSRAQVVLTLIDQNGRELRRIAGTRSRDPLLDFTAETDGPYFVRVHDLLYRGGDEYHYRLSIGTGPWIDFVDPPVLKPGADNAVTVYGRNLPGGAPVEGLEIEGRPIEKLAVSIKAPTSVELPIQTLLRPGDSSADLVSWNLPDSNPVRFLLAEESPTAEVEPNDTPDKAQPIKPPALIVGRFNPRGDRDWYTFEASKGDKLWIEVVSQRLGLPVDPQVVIQQAEASKDLQEIDDLASPLPAMQNNLERRYRAHSDDPAILFTVPADGKYRILVRDLFGSAQGDPRLFYALSVRPPKPDFRLVAFPHDPAPNDGAKLSQVNCIVRRGGSDRLRMIAYRREGFDGAIRVEAEGLPPGLSARPAVIAPGETSADFIFKSAPDAPSFAGPIRIVGKSADLTRAVRSAEILWNVADMQKEPVVTRMTESVGVAIDDHFVAPLGLQVVGSDVLRMARGGKLRIPVKLVKNADAKDLDKASVKVVTGGLPGKQNEKPIAVKELTLTLAKPDGELELDITEKAPLGTLTFYLTGDVDVSYVRNPERVKRAQEEQKRIDALATELGAEAKKAAEEKGKADKEATEATAAVAKLKGATGTAEAQFKEAEEKVKAADEAKAKAVEADKKAQELLKAADAAKKEWADELKKATDASKEKKIKVWFSSMSIMVDIVAVPVTLKSPDAVTIKAGEKAEVAVEIVREFGFVDEVKIEMAGSAPVKVAAVTAAGAQAQAPVVLTTEKTAKPGTYTVTLRGSLKYNAKALTVDRPIQVTIEAAAPQ
jgi:hypothetical protein